MAAIPLSELGSVYASRNVPWAKSPIKIGKMANLPGVMPDKLKGHAFKTGEVRPCVDAAVKAGARGAELVKAINKCVQTNKGGPSKKRRKYN